MVIYSSFLNVSLGYLFKVEIFLNIHPFLSPSSVSFYLRLSLFPPKTCGEGKIFIALLCRGNIVLIIAAK